MKILPNRLGRNNRPRESRDLNEYMDLDQFIFS